MSKRDYRSYNILGDEIGKEIVTQEKPQENDSTVIVETIAEEIDTNVTLDSKIEDTLEDIQVENRQSIDMSIEVEDKDQPNDSNRKFVGVSTHHVEEQSDNEKNAEPIQVGQNYKENYSAHSIKDLKQENVGNDTTFSNYKSSYHNKKRSRLAKWSIFIVKCILIIMLLPFIFILGAGILMFLGCFILGILGSIGIGVYLIGLTSFYSTQISEMLIALGITSSITMLSLGAILFIILSMMIRKAKEVIQKYRKTKKVNSNRESI